MTMMSKSELRKARKLARANNQPLVGMLAIRSNPTASNRTKNRKNSRKRAAARATTNNN